MVYRPTFGMEKPGGLGGQFCLAIVSRLVKMLAAALTLHSQSSTCKHPLWRLPTPTGDLLLYSSSLLSFSFLLLFCCQTNFRYCDLVLPSLQINLWVLVIQYRQRWSHCEPVLSFKPIKICLNQAKVVTMETVKISKKMVHDMENMVDFQLFHRREILH